MVNVGYQREDERVIDYGLWRLDGLDSDMRGPPLDLRPGEYAVALGAAQTFGRFVLHPYTELLSARIGLPVLNLGFSGAGATFFLERPVLMQAINEARFAIVQAMSGRSVSNSRFEVHINQGQVRDRRDAEAPPVFAETAYCALLREGDAYAAARLRAEIRWRYVQETRQLLAAIRPPKLLLYFSSRAPDYEENLQDIAGYWGGFPHFVNRSVLDALRPDVDAYAECICGEGLPQPLFDKDSGGSVEMWPEAQFPNVKLRTHNLYYPSPEMHVAAAAALEAPARALAAAPPRPRPARPPRVGKRDVLVHVHIFKNAGLSVDAMLAHSFGDRFLPVDPASPKAIFTQADLYALLAERPNIAALASHQLRPPIDDGPEVRLFPYFLLRDPIDRLHSIYAYEASEARQATSTIPVTRWAKEHDFRGFVEKCWSFERSRGLVSNFQTRALSAQAGSSNADWERPMSATDLYTALTFMDRLPAVGIVEQFDRSLQQLKTTYGRIFPELQFAQPTRKNRFRNVESVEEGRRIVRDELGPTAYAKILQGNALDLELYRVARERLGS